MWKVKEFGVFLLVLCAVFVVSAWVPIPKEEGMQNEIPVVTPRVAWQASVQVLMENQNYTEQQRKAEELREKQEQERKEEELRREREKKRQAKKRAKEQRQRKILERIVEAEAGDQDLQGRILVANVVLNRVRSKQFPNSIEKVVFAKGQFSPVSNGRYEAVTVSNLSRRAVKKAFAGVDYSQGALYFMCRSASEPQNVSWFDRDLTKVTEHGCHEFFR